jgi:5-histidylcysteine sulfoxide synthase/putative 4-mercaptohistidine N1-methyltranferase
MNNTLFPRSPLLNASDVTVTREALLTYFLSTFNRYEQLFETLVSEESYQVKPIALRHPLIFYFGHTATFYVNKLLLAGLLNKHVNPKFESMFAVGVDEMRWDDLNEAHYDWPSSAEVKHYRSQVLAEVKNIIKTSPFNLPIDWDHPWWVIIMGIEHERIHLETSSVLIRQQVLELVKPHIAWQPCTKYGNAPKNDLVTIPAGGVYLDKQKESGNYGWDNEYGLHEALIPEFQASRYLVSNEEFLEFVVDAGYTDDTFWGEEGLEWKRFAQAIHPTFWFRKGDTWWLRLMTEEIAMPWNWPVEVNYHEAKAFCKWKAQKTGLAIRLPSEDEWYRLYEFSGITEVANDQVALSNTHLDHAASACPITEFRHGELYDVTGNVWQWTETPIYPFSGFSVHPLYDDFTTPTFDGRHNLMKGGSWISCGNETLHSARFSFRRHFFQHAGFRYVVADELANIPVSHYETDKLISEYAEFHYGDSYFGVENFTKSLVDIAISAMKNKPARNALDLGCASGRATFELARHFEHVIGIDFSVRLIESGLQMAEKGELHYTLVNEGHLISYKARTLASLGLDKLKGTVEFAQGDACNLKPILTNYDLIFAANLIDRLYSPKRFLSHVHERLNIGGILLIASPYTWLEEHTKQEEWIGGFKKNAENFTTFDGLKEQLSTCFRLIATPVDVPFVIRETKRKFQHSLSEVTLWERIN